MHPSAKLNVYFGVPNLSEELLPEHLRYLVSFMARRPMNLFFPVSVSVSTICHGAARAKRHCHRNPVRDHRIYDTGHPDGLAVAEHWFLVAPLNANALCGWADEKLKLKTTPRATKPLSGPAYERGRLPEASIERPAPARMFGVHDIDL